MLRHLDIEVSSTCQASCPICVRHKSGVKVIDPVNQSLNDVMRSYRAISKNLKTITMCGNIGDSMGNKDIALICRWFIMRNPDILISVHTNGGLGSPSTYKELAMLGVRVIFGIDGLEDTNHYHRSGVKWSNIVRNLEAYNSGFENKMKVRWTNEFNDDGGIGEYGMAEIQMILWRHNQHQILDMADFAQQHRANLWYRKPVITPHPECNGGMPVHSVTGRWVCNLHTPDDHIAELSSERFLCPATYHEGNNMRDHVVERLTQTASTNWQSLLNNPIPVDQTNKPEKVDEWKDVVNVRYNEPVREHKYDIEFTEIEAQSYNTTVACKSYNFNKPADLLSTDADKEVFIGADGYVMPCCMMGSALSLHLQNALEDEDNTEINRIKKDLVNRVMDIGIDKFDSSKHDLDRIMNSGVLHELVYNNIRETDVAKGRIPFCSYHCGTHDAIGRPSKDSRDSG